MNRLLLASNNLHKLREFRELFKKLRLSFDLATLLDYPKYSSPPENGDTFEANATIKAVDAAKKNSCWSLADDSGLVVPSLQNAPGVYSARYAGTNATDRENRKKLLAAMQDLTADARMAYFECCLVLANPKGEVHKVVSAQVYGTIEEQERGNNGFGYDPLFIKYDYSKTFAELDEEVKNCISHRYKALEKMAGELAHLAQAG